MGSYFWGGGGSNAKLNVDWGQRGAVSAAPVIVPENTVGRRRGDTLHEAAGRLVNLRAIFSQKRSMKSGKLPEVVVVPPPEAWVSASGV